MVDHVMGYRAGSVGLSRFGIPDVSTAHWYCSCGGWRVYRSENGVPFRPAAEKRHATHVALAGRTET
jgi:hypothetical protein